MILVSACLIGENCRYEGSGVTAAYLDSLGIKVFSEKDIDKIKYELNN